MKMFIVRTILIWFGLLEKHRCTYYFPKKRHIYYYVWKVSPYQMFKDEKK